MRSKEVILKKFIIVLLFILSNSLAWSQQKVLIEDEKNSISVFQNTADSIVNVSNMRITKSFFDMDASEVQAGMGSGFVWDKQGYIVTNFHVVQDGDSYQVSFKDDKKQYKAKLIGVDPKKDTAVLKLEEMPKNLKPIPIGESKGLLVGQKTLAIGNPLGLDHTLTTGVVSALDRKIPGIGGVSITGMIQTDASINPGNSGGALLDSQGKLIGMNTMIFNAGGTQASAGLGFAIPVDTIKNVVPQLIKFGKVIRPGIGIAILEDGYARRYGIDQGVMIKYVDPKGPAAKAGLRGITRDRRGQYYFGDIILEINGNKIKNFDDLFSTIDSYKIGEKIKVKYSRENKEKTIEIQLVQI
jgi:S1-C subfamily serine protease